MDADWIGQFSADDASSLERAQLLSARDDAREAAAERHAQDQRQAAREQRFETLAFANRQAGNPVAELQRQRQLHAEAEAEAWDLAERLRKAEARRDRAQSNIEFFASRMQQATELAQRSADDDLVVVQLSSGHREFATRTRQMMREARAGAAKPEPRPFVSGLAARSEVSCLDCVTAGATPDQSVLIHLEDDAPEPRYVPDHPPATRRDTDRRVPMIFR